MDAQCRYELGIDRKLGIILEQVCEAPGLSCCQVYVPRNPEDAAARRLQGGLQFLLPDQARRAHCVTSKVYWAWLKMRGEQHPLKAKS
jgi:hypothetical protein